MIKSHSDNCGICGEEHSTETMKFVKLTSFGSGILICKGCYNRAPSELFKEAAEILSEIVSIAVDDKTADNRLERIKKLLLE